MSYRYDSILTFSYQPRPKFRIGPCLADKAHSTVKVGKDFDVALHLYLLRHAVEAPLYHVVYDVCVFLTPETNGLKIKLGIFLMLFG